MVELTVELNARLQPIHRGEMFEEPLENVLIQANVGEVLGGGTFMSATGEIEKCDITLEVKDDWIAKVFAYLQRDKCFMFSWWEGGTETALYFYGESYLKLYESVKHILEIHPLCKLSHVKQVA